MKRWSIFNACVLGALFFSTEAAAFNPLESENGDVKKGNALLAENQFGDALEAYDGAARSLPGRGAIHLNRGLALSRSGDEQYDQAMQAFNLASDGGGTEPIRARAHYNLGNLFFKKEDYKAAIEHYKKSLMLQPGDKDVAWNLELAKTRKKQQDEQQEENQDQEQDQDGEQQQDEGQEQDPEKDGQEPKQDEEQQQDPQNEDKEDQDKPQDQQKQDQPQEEEQQPQPQPQPQPKTRQEMEQILDSLENGEDNLAKEKAKQQPMFIPRGGYKDW